jgi:hypothetical protein
VETAEISPKFPSGTAAGIRLPLDHFTGCAIER